MTKNLHLVVKQKGQDDIDLVLPLNTAQDSIAFGNVIQNINESFGPYKVTVESVTEDEVDKLNKKSDEKWAENAQVTEDQTDKNRNTNVDAANVVQTTRSFNREDEDGNPTGFTPDAKSGNKTIKAPKK